MHCSGKMAQPSAAGDGRAHAYDEREALARDCSDTTGEDESGPEVEDEWIA